MEDYKDYIMFNIDNLIPPEIKNRIENIDSLEDKINYLFNLIDLYYNFNAADIDLIKAHYIQNTGSPDIPQINLSSDDKNFVLEYAAVFNDFDKVKALINGLCDDNYKDDVINRATSEMMDYELRQQEEREDAAIQIYSDLEFDNDNNHETIKKQKSLTSIFADIENRKTNKRS